MTSIIGQPVCRLETSVQKKLEWAGKALRGSFAGIAKSAKEGRVLFLTNRGEKRRAGQASAQLPGGREKIS